NPFVPGLLANIVGSPLDYSYKTEKNEKACLSSGGVCTWPRGRMLSGTGSFSGMLYTRPSPSIFDNWATRLGNKGWSSKEVLEFFKKSENNLNPDLIEKDQHGFAGPLTIQRFSSQPPFADDILKAAEALGYKGNDLSGSKPNGLNYVQGMVDQGIRASTARMYLGKKLNQTNLVVKLNAQVQKINFSGTKATGVTFKDLKTGEIVTVNVTKEDTSYLSSYCHSTNSSTNLFLTLVDFLVRTSCMVADPCYRSECKDNQKLLNATADHDDFIAKLTSIRTSRNTAFIDDLIKKYASIVGNAITGPLPCGRRRVGVRPNNMLPLSKGRLVLRSANPDDHPKLITNYLDNEQDAKVLLQGVRIAQRIMLSESLKKYDVQLVFMTSPSCAGYTKDSDDYWLCIIRQFTLAENHPTGTCKMGPASDPEAVVDDQLLVHGVENVRVADASVFPTQLNCNPISVVIMTAEKCAQMVLDKNKV
ncbi:glucose dehydrogenase [FAD, quinone]-like, partial [Diaphorina citri]|uniref:Glucose dehydrogenase [FAD, quinone]-like n=1 Tax=Diaphorina citri TaxID=121845 RepID=A0A1S3DAT5_DIACI